MTAADRLVVRTVAVDDPHDLLAHLAGPGSVAWVRGGEGLVGWGVAATVPVGTGAGRLDRAAAALAELFGACQVHDEVGVPGSGPVAFGALTFDPRSPGSLLVVPRVVLGRRGPHAWRTAVGDPGEADEPAPPLPTLPPPGRVRYAGSTLPELRWLEAVDAAARAVRAGDLAKVVLARDLHVWAAEPLEPRLLARRLAARFPACFTFVCDGLVGATPELLVRRTGDAVTSLVLAGSAARGGDPATDERLGDALRHSGKDRLEHDLAVASVGDVLTLRCDGLTADAEPWLLRLDNVQHLATRVAGRLTTGDSALTLAAALHPTAAVCGTPTAAALAVIRDSEGMDRGRYAGPVGWVDARGDGEWGIALRCAEVAGTRARLFAGAGIVGASLPEAELEETRLKLRAMQSALEGDAPA